MSVQFRPFSDPDWPGYVELGNAVFPDYRDSVEEVRASDAVWDPRFFKRRLVAEADGGWLVGRGVAAHLPEEFHPDKYEIEIDVHPDHRRQGIGGALYDRLLAELRERGAISVRGAVKEDEVAGRAFAEARGFGEVQREWESRLDVAGFDFGAFADAEERAAAAGITITTLAAERARDPDVIRAAHALYTTCNEDVPSVDPVTELPFEQWLGNEVDHPSALLDGYFLAVADGRYVGQSNLFETTEDPSVLYQGLTGVRREYRGKGVAMALKLRTVRYAREHGKREIRTWNDTRNRPMLRINEAMGFAKQPAWIALLKDLTDGG